MDINRKLAPLRQFEVEIRLNEYWIASNEGVDFYKNNVFRFRWFLKRRCSPNIFLK